MIDYAKLLDDAIKEYATLDSVIITAETDVNINDYISVKSCKLEGLNLHCTPKTIFTDCIISDCAITGKCCFEGCEFSTSRVGEFTGQFKNCKFNESVFRDQTTDTTIVECDFEQVTFDNDMIGCDFVDTKLHRCQLSANMSFSELRNVDINNCNIMSVFADSALYETRISGIAILDFSHCRLDRVDTGYCRVMRKITIKDSYLVRCETIMDKSFLSGCTAIHN